MFSGGAAGEREIEEHQVQLVAPADLAHRDVVRLDVAVRDALLFQVVDHVEQVFAESLEEIDVEPAFLARRWPSVSMIFRSFSAAARMSKQTRSPISRFRRSSTMCVMTELSARTSPSSFSRSLCSGRWPP